MVFETKRLVLRPWTEADAEDLYCYASDPDVGPAAGWLPHQNIEESREAIKTYFSTRPQAYAVCFKTDNRAIGAIELKLSGHSNIAQKDDECELGFWIGKPFWGQGLITEAAQEILRYAFEDLNMTIVYCAYYDGNVKSKRVQEKLGFKHQQTTEGIKLPLLNETRTRHVNTITKTEWTTNG